MGDLTAHFDWLEFRSHDGRPMPLALQDNVKKTAEMLEVLRGEVSKYKTFDCPIRVLSGYRTPEWNAQVGGAPTSLHLKGMAADVVSKFLSPLEIQLIARRLQDAGTIGGLGLYLGFTHVDWGEKRSWTEATKGY